MQSSMSSTLTTNEAFPNGKSNGAPVEEDKHTDEDFVDTVTRTSLLSGKYAKRTPMFCLKEGLSCKDSAFKLDSWVKLALTLDGRDKITKVLQYSARFLAWWLVGSRHQERFQNLKGSLTTSRKAFRLGRSLIEYHKLRSLGISRVISNHLWKSASTPIPAEDAPLWKILGSALKMIGLCGFWAGDNISFVTSSGLFDNLRAPSKADRLSQRKQLQTRASLFANRSYFCGSVAGLLVNFKAYCSYRASTLQTLREENEEESENDERLQKAKEKEFVLFLALLKSCCDVLVFSNNPGIDLWIKARGRKLHEGIHCVAGLMSASTILYNNFPNKKTS